MKSIAVLVCVVLAAAAAVGAVSLIDLVREEWSAFKMEHSKEYDSDVEDKFRMKIYVENKHRIAKHNQRYEQGAVTYKLGSNKFADMLHHEFVHTMNGFNKTTKNRFYSNIPIDGPGANPVRAPAPSQRTPNIPAANPALQLAHDIRRY